MALNLKTFKTRTLTAIVFAAVMLAGLFINAWSFISLFIIIMIGCLYEYGKIVKLISPQNYFYYLPLSIVYIIMPVLMMIYMGIRVNISTVESEQNILSYSYILPCSIIFSIWINDTMAYLVGSFIGKTTLSKISPKKTWEGTIGGGLLCIGTIALLGYTIPAASEVAVKHWVAIAALCAIFGTLGDLLESKLKRMAGVKDSGNFMPGHGGFLDRFDSLLVATPAVWIYVVAFM